MHYADRTAECPTCNTTFHNLDRDEDGRPEIPDTKPCNSPGCEARFCSAACEHLTFSCEGCGKRFCLEHKVDLGELYCGPCALDAVESWEPECTCQQTDVDLFSAVGCELHYSESAWNAMRRAVTSAQEYAHAMGDVA